MFEKIYIIYVINYKLLHLILNQEKNSIQNKRIFSPMKFNIKYINLKKQ